MVIMYPAPGRYPPDYTIWHNSPLQATANARIKAWNGCSINPGGWFVETYTDDNRIAGTGKHARLSVAVKKAIAKSLANR